MRSCLRVICFSRSAKRSLEVASWMRNDAEMFGRHLIVAASLYCPRTRDSTSLYNNNPASLCNNVPSRPAVYLDDCSNPAQRQLTGLPPSSRSVVDRTETWPCCSPCRLSCCSQGGRENAESSNSSLANRPQQGCT